MYQRIRTYWGLPFFVGLLFMLAGSGMVILPFKTYYTLSLIFCISFIVSGISEITMGIFKEQFLESKIWRIAGGITDLFIGVILFPGFSIFGLSYLLAFSLMFRSIVMMGLSFSLRLYDGVGWLWLFATSILCLLLSLLMIWNPNITGFGIGLFTGLTFFGIGLFIFLFSIRLRRIELIH